MLSDVSGQQCEQLPRLAALSALSSLSLSTAHDTMGLPVAELLQLLSDGSLRELALKAHYGFDRRLPLTPLSRLQVLALDVAEIQASRGWGGCREL